MKASDRPLEQSVEAPDPFTQTGGARIGASYWWSVNATWPFARLSVSNEGLELKTLGARYRFSKADIQRLSVYSGFFTKGVQVHHAIARYPRFVVFWTPNFQDLVANLQSSGFRVE